MSIIKSCCVFVSAPIKLNKYLPLNVIVKLIGMYSRFVHYLQNYTTATEQMIETICLEITYYIIFI